MISDPAIPQHGGHLVLYPDVAIALAKGLMVDFPHASIHRD